MERIDQLLEDYIARKEIAGAAVWVYQEGKPVYEKVFGYADIEKRRPVTKDTIFRLASMTKPLTGIAVMKLVEEGKLSLDTRLSDYIPEFKERKVLKKPVDLTEWCQDPEQPLGEKALEEEIARRKLVEAKHEVTVFHCLNHCSGVGMGPIGNGWINNHITPQMSLKERVKIYGQAPGDFEAGKGTGYSAVAAFDCLGRLVELVSGMSFQEYLQQNIMKPMGITDITFTLNEEQKERLCRLYEYENGSLTDVTDSCPDWQLMNPALCGYYSGGAGCFGTLQSYVKIVEMLYNKGFYQGVRILRPETVELMAGKKSRNHMRFSKGARWGLSMAVFEEPKAEDRGLEPGTFGWSGAFGTHFYVDWVNRMAVVLMVNRSNIGGAGSHVSLALEHAIYKQVSRGKVKSGQTTLYMLSEQSTSQMMSYVIQSREGKLIVIDGGMRQDARHLMDTLIGLGGPEPVIDLWLLTHPHCDHIDALLKIFSKPNPLRVKKIYSRFLSYEFYKANDFPGCTDAKTVKAFQRFEAAHPDICFSFRKGQKLKAGSVEIHVLRVPKEDTFPMNVFNNSSVVFRMDAEGQRILFVGDLGEEAGDDILETVPKEELQADFVQMAHHGQNGVKKSFYEAVAPKACLWNTPGWLWDNTLPGKELGTGPWRTMEVREWMKELGVKHHFVTKDGDHVLKLPHFLD